VGCCVESGSLTDIAFAALRSCLSKRNVIDDYGLQQKLKSAESSRHQPVFAEDSNVVRRLKRRLTSFR